MMEISIKVNPSADCNNNNTKNNPTTLKFTKPSILPSLKILNLPQHSIQPTIPPPPPKEGQMIPGHPSIDERIVGITQIFRAGYSDTIGFRDKMEDELVLVGSFRNHSDENYFGIFDGHSGDSASRYCAKKLHTFLEKRMNEHNDPRQALIQAFADCHESLRQINTESGTTAVVAYFIGDSLYIANCGDSRAVISQARVGRTITIDHKPNSETEKKRIESIPGGYILKNRVQGKLAVSRSLGDFSLNPYVISEPDVFGPYNWKDPSYDFLILACDGLWDVTNEEEAIQIASTSKNPLEAAVKLRDDAYDKRSRDNISVLVIWFPEFIPTIPKKESSSETSDEDSGSGSGSGSGSESESEDESSGDEESPRNNTEPENSPLSSIRGSLRTPRRDKNSSTPREKNSPKTTKEKIIATLSIPIQEKISRDIPSPKETPPTRNNTTITSPRDNVTTPARSGISPKNNNATVIISPPQQRESTSGGISRPLPDAPSCDNSLTTTSPQLDIKGNTSTTPSQEKSHGVIRPGLRGTYHTHQKTLSLELPNKGVIFQHLEKKESPRDTNNINKTRVTWSKTLNNVSKSASNGIKGKDSLLPPLLNSGPKRTQSVSLPTGPKRTLTVPTWKQKLIEKEMRAKEKAENEKLLKLQEIRRIATRASLSGNPSVSAQTLANTTTGKQF